MFLLNILCIKINKDLKQKEKTKRRRTSLRLKNIFGRHSRLGEWYARFFLFSFLDYSRFACYPPESFQIIYLTSIRSKFGQKEINCYLLVLWPYHERLETYRWGPLSGLKLAQAKISASLLDKILVLGKLYCFTNDEAL